MTVITYGTSLRSNAKTRRHERRRDAAIERDTIGNIIDSVFGLIAQSEAQEEPRKVASRVDKAISATEYKMKPRSQPEQESGGVCLAEVAIFNAGYRKSDGVTAR